MGKDNHLSVWMYESSSLSSITGKTAIPVNVSAFPGCPFESQSPFLLCKKSLFTFQIS